MVIITKAQIEVYRTDRLYYNLKVYGIMPKWPWQYLTFGMCVPHLTDNRGNIYISAESKAKIIEWAPIVSASENGVEITPDIGIAARRAHGSAMPPATLIGNRSSRTNRDKPIIDFVLPEA